jgi:hypothetical protein
MFRSVSIDREYLPAMMRKFYAIIWRSSHANFELIMLLNEILVNLDRLVEQCVEKIKTIDCYMVASGVPNPVHLILCP